jgi:hypothetical protein
MQNVPQAYPGKIMIAVMGINFHFSEQYAGEGIEKMKNKKNSKWFNCFKFKILCLR